MFGFLLLIDCLCCSNWGKKYSRWLKKNISKRNWLSQNLKVLCNIVCLNMCDNNLLIVSIGFTSSQFSEVVSHKLDIKLVMSFRSSKLFLLGICKLTYYIRQKDFKYYDNCDAFSLVLLCVYAHVSLTTCT